MKEICKNDILRVYLYKINKKEFDLVLKHPRYDQIIHSWKIKKKGRWWRIYNHQIKDGSHFDREFVMHSGKWKNVDDLIGEFIEISDCFTNFFNFPKD
jgi:hypothetical protein